MKCFALLCVLVLVSCSDMKIGHGDDADGVAGNVKLVKTLDWVMDESKDYFVYDEHNRVVGLTQSGYSYGTSGETGREWSKSFTFSYTEDKLEIYAEQYLQFYFEFHKGSITSDEGHAYQFDVNDRLSEEGDYLFRWDTSGNIHTISDSYDEREYKYSYTSIEDKTNVSIYGGKEVPHSFKFNRDKNVFGGFYSRNLISKIEWPDGTSWTYEYRLDDDGYVTEMICRCEDYIEYRLFVEYYE